jgi:AraC-like DNA-binding protein
MADLGQWQYGGDCSFGELGDLEALAPTCDFDGKKLARMFNLSQRHLQRIFLARFACSPQAWLNERRLLLAWQMLQTANSVKEVAYSLGFRRASQFSRDFRRMFGQTPSEVSSRAHLGYSAASSQNLAGAMRSERQRGQRLGEVTRSRSRNSNAHSRQLAGA